MTYSWAISFKMISTRSILARASAARALVPFGHFSERRPTTFCSAARAASVARINATHRAIRRGFPSDSAKMSAATISAADSSEMVRSGLRFRKGNQHSPRPEGIAHGQAFARKGKSDRTTFVNRVRHNGRKAGLSPAPLCSLPITGGTPSQGGRNPFGLPVSFAFAARRPGQPFVASDFHTPSKAHENQVAHLSFLSVAALAERHPVSAT
jgi:hypothetical protein